jgi:predicted PurR-regulated permease PerM
MDKEKKEPNVDKEDSKKESCPISVDCWMSCLSNEINNWTVIYYMIGTMCATLLIVILSIIIAVLQHQPKLFVEQIHSAAYTSICAILALYIFLMFIICLRRFQKIVKTLEKIRGKIISGELNTPNKIREEWKYKIRTKKKRN